MLGGKVVCPRSAKPAHEVDWFLHLFPPAFVFGAAFCAGLVLGESLFQGEPNSGTLLHDRRVELVALVGREVGRPLAHDTYPVDRRRAYLYKAPLGVLVRLNGQSA